MECRLNERKELRMKQYCSQTSEWWHDLRGWEGPNSTKSIYFSVSGHWIHTTISFGHFSCNVFLTIPLSSFEDEDTDVHRDSITFSRLDGERLRLLSHLPVVPAPCSLPLCPAAASLLSVNAICGRNCALDLVLWGALTQTLS